MHIKYTDISPEPPYDFEEALNFYKTSPSSILERIYMETQKYERAFTFSGQPVLVQVTNKGTINSPKLEVKVTGEYVDDTIVNQAVARLKRIFSLDGGLEPFRTLASNDPVLQEKIKPHEGLRPVLFGDPFETLVWGIIGQLINVSFAKKLKFRLQELCGDTFYVDGEAYPVFPSPKQIIALGEDKLRDNQFSRQKAEYLITASKAVENGDIDFDALAHMSYEETSRSLMNIKGIGRWTAEYVLMRGLGFQDIIPAGDLGLKDIIGHHYKNGRRASENEVREIAEAWSPWRSWAAFTWWLHLQLNIAGKEKD